MTTWRPVSKWLAASTGFAALATVGVVVLGPDGSAMPAVPHSASAPTSTARGPRPAAPLAAGDDEALVDRMLDQLRAGKPVESQIGSDSPLQGVPIAALKAIPGQQLALGRLRIPRLNLDDDLNNGVDEAALLHGVGHWPGTPLPGTAGNSVISGHRSTKEKPFLHLDKLRAGDLIMVTVGTRTTSYRVFRTTIVPESQYVRFVLRKPSRPGDRVITLFACNPLTAHYQRIVVQARAV